MSGAKFAQLMKAVGSGMADELLRKLGAPNPYAFDNAASPRLNQVSPSLALVHK